MAEPPARGDDRRPAAPDLDRLAAALAELLAAWWRRQAPSPPDVPEAVLDGATAADAGSIPARSRP